MLLRNVVQPQYLVAALVFGTPATSLANGGVELEVFSTSFSGNACVSINHTCAEPSAATLTLDGTTLYSGVSPQWIPEAPCIDTTAFTNGYHQLEVTSTCDGQTTTDSQTVLVENASFGFDWIAAGQFEYNGGDTISLEIDLGESGLAVTADFSSFDSAYQHGDEIVRDAGDGTYLISYRPGSTSSPGVGAYDVEISARSGRTIVRHTAKRVINFAPTPTPRIAASGDLSSEIVFEAPPSGDRSRLQVVYASLPTTAVTIGAETPVQFWIWTAEPLPDDTVTLDIAENGGSGYIRTVAETSSEWCGWGGCYYAVDASVTLRPSAVGSIPAAGQTVDLLVGVEANFGPGDVHSPFFPAGGMFYKPETEGPYAVIGVVDYLRVQDFVAENPSGSKFPQYNGANETVQASPVSDTELVLYDGCGGSKSARTYADGTFAILYDTDCPGSTAHVEIRTEAHRGYLNTFITDTQDSIYQQPIATGFVPSSYDTIYISHRFWRDSVLWGAISALQQAVRHQRWSKTFLVGNQPVSNMPLLHVRYEPGYCPVGTSQYLTASSIVEVCGEADNDDAEHEFAMSHEYFHWFQDQFMADMKGNSGTWPESGSFGEGFANMMPAVATGTAHRIEKFSTVFETEWLDYTGNIKTDGSGVLSPQLPVDLYLQTWDQGSGGWSWRLLWDFLDGVGGEPETVFQRDVYGGSATPVDYGDFDGVGSAQAYKDVLLNYLGGDLIGGNLANDVGNANYGYVARGVDAGLGTSEFLDGVICRGWHTASEVESISLTMLDFQFYDASSAPMSCP